MEVVKGITVFLIKQFAFHANLHSKMLQELGKKNTTKFLFLIYVRSEIDTKIPPINRVTHDSYPLLHLLQKVIHRLPQMLELP